MQGAAMAIKVARVALEYGMLLWLRDEITIGRGAENDVIIPENFVSHRHATIFLHGAQYVIEDLGSVNHTYVNGQMLEGKAYLKPNDEIRIGMVTLKFER